MPPVKEVSSDGEMKSSAKRTKFEKGTEDYVRRRERNNIAVRKSRERSRMKAKETAEQINKLKTENLRLNQKVQILSKELSVLKDLFMAHAGAVSLNELPNNNQDTLIKPAKNNDHQYSIVVTKQETDSQ